jgi:hypothetical protein
MPGDNLAPVEHLKHLLRKHKDGKQFGSKELIEKASGGVDARIEVMTELERGFPGTWRMLERTWRWHGATAVHLWHLPTVIDLSEKAIVSVVKKNLRVTPIERPTELDGELTAAGQARIQSIELSDNILLATVRKATPKRWHREGEELSDFSTEDIDVALDLSRERAIIEAYATQKNARVAVNAFVTNVLGLVLPPKSGPARERLLKPVIFTESIVASVAKKLRMGDESGLVGIDAKNEHGEVHLYGKKAGTVTRPLIKSDRFRSQWGAKNDIRQFLLTFKHDDGYEHESNVQFYFKSGQHPHLKFMNKTSRPAVYRVVDEVCELATK